jgi:tRNA dimethylallyltransferase
MDNPLIVIVGPTCVGKTEASIYLAEKLNGEIISADSRTFYKGMDIGTAKPTQAELDRVPHHLINVAVPDNTWNLAFFQQNAQAAIAEIHSRKNIPFLVGGTGQYIRSVAYNWSPPSISPNPILRKTLENMAEIQGKEFLYSAVQLLDPDAAQIIDFRNVRRTIRALEVIFSSGVRFSSQRRENISPYRLITVGLERSRVDLYKRIDLRIEKMFAEGFVKEVKTLLEMGYSPELPSMSAIGYRECAKAISGEFTIEQAIEEIKRKTRIFVRRQANWFKPTDRNIHWFNIANNNFSEIEEFLQLSLKSM